MVNALNFDSKGARPSLPDGKQRSIEIEFGFYHLPMRRSRNSRCPLAAFPSATERADARVLSTASPSMMSTVDSIAWISLHQSTNVAATWNHVRCLQRISNRVSKRMLSPDSQSFDCAHSRIVRIYKSTLQSRCITAGCLYGA